ncbi:MAG: 5-formyltetrahydrofolate cyclo-ligase [Oscillospiraceae bacterium]
MQVVDIREEKKRMRQHYKSVRDNLSLDEKDILDEKLLRKVTQLWSYREENLLITYVSTGSEVDTRELIKFALADGKKVAVPRCIENTRDMEFYLIKSFDDLAPGSFGVMEPVKEKCELLEDYSNGVCLVPAIAFDKKGYRLGYGKGYYDRFLSRYSGRVLGICYSSCICSSLPHGRFDRKVASIVTEKRIITTT